MTKIEHESVDKNDGEATLSSVNRFIKDMSDCLHILERRDASCDICWLHINKVRTVTYAVFKSAVQSNRSVRMDQMSIKSKVEMDCSGTHETSTDTSNDQDLYEATR